MQNIIDTTLANGHFKTLGAALGAAKLYDTLKGAGPFTVFAPTDEAFAKIPEADLAALMADRDRLKKVLTFHVVSGKLTGADVGHLKDGAKVKTVQGGELTLHLEGGKVRLDQSTVTQTDILATNGIIHQIDTVLMPT